MNVEATNFRREVGLAKVVTDVDPEGNVKAFWWIQR